MKCSKCGFETESDSVKFCPSCGAPVSIAVSSNGMPLEKATPWRRWSARLFDLWLGYFVVGFMQGIVAPNLEIKAVVMLLAYIPLALCLEGLEYWAFGGTFGKWVFSVKVLDPNGGKISGAKYGKRLFLVWLAGLGLGIPIATLITEIWQYRRLENGKAASYDEKVGLKVVQYKQGFVKGLVCVLFILVWLALNAIGNAMD